MQVSSRAATAPTDLSQSYVLDLNAVESLKASASHDPKNAIKQVASQFEAMFLNTLMKTMRETSFDGESDSNAMDMYQGMFDQQLVQQLAGSGRGTGLAAALEKQLAKAAGVDMGEDTERASINGEAREMSSIVQTMSPSAASGARRSTLETALSKLTEPKIRMDAPATTAASTPAAGTPSEFTRALLPHAQQAAQELGVAPHLVVAHAALESGWGKKPIRHPDGSDSHNLFSIKASGSWKGKTVDIMTTEYVDGAPQKRVERFRAYDNYQEAFTDYARLLKNNPRYQGALNQGDDASAFARGLARGGYATDPNYAAKLSQLAGKSSS